MAAHLLADPSNIALGHLDIFELLQNLCQATTTHVLHGDLVAQENAAASARRPPGGSCGEGTARAYPELILDSVAVEVADDVGVRALLHDVDLRGQKLNVLGVERHLLDGNLQRHETERIEHTGVEETRRSLSKGTKGQRESGVTYLLVGVDVGGKEHLAGGTLANLGGVEVHLGGIILADQVVWKKEEERGRAKSELAAPKMKMKASEMPLKHKKSTHEEGGTY